MLYVYRKFVEGLGSPNLILRWFNNEVVVSRRKSASRQNNHPTSIAYRLLAALHLHVRHLQRGNPAGHRPGRIQRVEQPPKVTLRNTVSTAHKSDLFPE